MLWGSVYQVIDLHGTAQPLISFSMVHTLPCPSPGCTVAPGRVQVCLDIEHRGMMRIHAHVEPGQTCGTLGQAIHRKVMLLAGLRFHARCN